MPGILPHLIAGCSMFIIGRFYYRNYFDGKEKFKERLLLLFVCIMFSFIADFFLIIYYTTKILPFDTLLPYHNLVFIIIGPIAIFFLLLIKFVINLKREPIWMMGLWAIILHVIMDYFIPDFGVWI